MPYSLFRVWFRTATPAAAQSAGVKRPRAVAPVLGSGPGTTSAENGASAEAGSVAPVVIAPPQRVVGSGAIITSGTSVHGTGTLFFAELKVGDAIEVNHPVSQKNEVRIVKMVLSDSSLGIKLVHTLTQKLHGVRITLLYLRLSLPRAPPCDLLLTVPHSLLIWQLKPLLTYFDYPSSHSILRLSRCV
jgi:hypothetical protein